ncbi:MAG: peptide deformylase [Candidatus Rokuibacteriota bacterium]|nr:MAG: peptide deformylase [Candidatus Rokubacteria bacterium]
MRGARRPSSTRSGRTPRPARTRRSTSTIGCGSPSPTSTGRSGSWTAPWRGTFSSRSPAPATGRRACSRSGRSVSTGRRTPPSTRASRRSYRSGIPPSRRPSPGRSTSDGGTVPPRPGRRRRAATACYNEPAMAILKVARLGHPVLRQVAEPVPVDAIRAAETQRLIDDMIETMREYSGAGLAATQVHRLVQVAVIEVLKGPRDPEAPEIPLTVLINPIVTPLTEQTEDGWEGCLSIPDMRGIVARWTAVRLEARDREGQPIDLKAADFFARVIQHESDHLNGIVYVDRMRDLQTLTHLAEWNRYWLGATEQND